MKELNPHPIIGITDDYGVYKNAFEHHQLCWSHPHRTRSLFVATWQSPVKLKERKKQTAFPTLGPLLTIRLLVCKTCEHGKNRI